MTSLSRSGFEGSVLKRPGSTYRPGRQPAWRNTYAVCELDGRRVTAFGSPRLAALIGHRVELAYSRIDADGTLREVRISAIDTV
jgi:hypothetical protein